MNPLYLGAGSRRLFALYEPPTAPASRLRAAVICQPWGAEYVYAHRSLRLLAQRLNAAGIHTLRFDYFGTGDSDGDMAQAELRGWERDTESAIETLQDMVGASQVVLIGLRVGAAVAARVAMRVPKQIESVVLWDPVVSGEEYVRSLEALGRPLPERGGAGIEVLGFSLTPAMHGELRGIDLRGYAAAPPVRTLMLVTEALPSHQPLHDAATAGPKPFEVESLAAPCPWIESVTVTGAVPARVLQRVTEWLA